MNSIKLKPIVALAALTALPCVASADITIGDTSGNFDGDTNGAINTISDFEVVAGSNRKLVLTINSETFASVTSITYGAQSFTKAVGTSGGVRLSDIWYLDDAAVGTADIVATFDANVSSYMGVVSLTGAAAGGPSAFATDLGFVDTDPTEASIDLTTTEANTFVIGAYTQQNGNGFPLNPVSMTDLYNAESGSSNSSAGYEIQTVAGTLTYTWHAPDGQNINSDNGVTIASFSSIPEPGAYALLAGLAGLGFVVMRRR